MYSYVTFEDKLREFQTLVAEKLSEVVPELAKRQELGQRMQDDETLKLCKDLITEEYNELIDAMEGVDNGEGERVDPEVKEHILKEAVDLIYVVVGMCVRYGLPLDLAFNRVHENNILKVKQGTVRPDGKLVKQPLHPKVRLRDLV